VLEHSGGKLGSVATHHGAVLEAVTGSGADEPYVLPVRMAIDQKIATRAVFILADVRLDDWA
jgi:hypothetical protein